MSISVINNMGFQKFGITDKNQSNVNDTGSAAKFADLLKDSFYEANNLKIDSDAKTADLLAGKTDNLHEVMIAAQKAELSITFVTEVRNRLVEAYQELSRMQL